MGKDIKKIKSISVPLGQGQAISFIVDHELLDQPKRKVGRIEDQGIEYQDATHFIYHVIDQDGRLIASIENCGAIVNYF